MTHRTLDGKERVRLILKSEHLLFQISGLRVDLLLQDRVVEMALQPRGEGQPC